MKIPDELSLWIAPKSNHWLQSTLNVDGAQFAVGKVCFQAGSTIAVFKPDSPQALSFPSINVELLVSGRPEPIRFALALQIGESVQLSFFPPPY